MKRSKFSEAQIAFVLTQAQDGTTISEPVGHPHLVQRMTARPGTR